MFFCSARCSDDFFPLQSKGSIAANAQELKELFEKVKVDNLRALYCDELPATANFIVFDRTQRGSNGTRSRAATRFVFLRGCLVRLSPRNSWFVNADIVADGGEP